ncbi:MAG: uroporphyrinogen-III C-methyltransferase [Deltaproteobacteria bacterium]|nr:uroporphyrinogen-III C-methyltransferase [Deltaproteobacteria bacterium]
MSVGVVYLVGAGPGDPGLLTLRGRECIAQADVLVHDYLVDGRLLRFARPGATIVASGKSGDAARRDDQQREINRRMVAEALAGKTVVRLKGGDPFVFGRGGEEAQALVDAGVPFEVVPGVSSATAVPAYAGIPLTERGLNSSFTVVTGHEAPVARQPLDWTALARLECIVVLMGLRELGAITARLERAGKPPNTPAACIRGGTRPDQRTVVGTLRDLPARVEQAGLEPPAVIVIGEVVRRRQALGWFERRPLLGRRILVTRAAEQATEFADRLERLGAEAIPAPVIELVAPESFAALDRALAEIASYDWVVFSSAHGVDVFFARLFDTGGDVRQLWRAELAAVGPATAQAITRRGIRVAVVPRSFRAEGLAESLAPRVGGKRVLLPRAEGARDVLPIALRAAGAEVSDVGTYRAGAVGRLPRRAETLLAAGQVDAVTFTSSSTVRHFCELLGADPARRLGAARVACIGPITAATAREFGLRVDVAAREYTIDDLTQALIDYFAGRS